MNECTPSKCLRGLSASGINLLDRFLKQRRLATSDVHAPWDPYIALAQWLDSEHSSPDLHLPKDKEIRTAIDAFQEDVHSLKMIGK